MLVETARAEPLWRWHINDTLAERQGAEQLRLAREVALQECGHGGWAANADWNVLAEKDVGQAEPFG